VKIPTMNNARRTDIVFEAQSGSNTKPTATYDMFVKAVSVMPLNTQHVIFRYTVYFEYFRRSMGKKTTVTCARERIFFFHTATARTTTTDTCFFF